MDEEKLNIGVVGCFQNGKSTFVNCLLDDIVARTGDGLATTSVNTKYVYGDVQSVRYFSDAEVLKEVTLNEFTSTTEFPEGTDEIIVSLWKPLLKNVNIVDTPGFNANDVDDATALKSLDGIDAAIVVLSNKGIAEIERRIIAELYKRRMPYFLLMNCTEENKRHPNSKNNIMIADSLYEELKYRNMLPLPIDGNYINSVNLLWFWYASEQYINETSEKCAAIERIIRISACQMDMELNSAGRKIFIEESNFLPIRNFFSSEKNGGIPLKCVKWKTSLSRCFLEWENKLNDIVSKIR